MRRLEVKLAVSDCYLRSHSSITPEDEVRCGDGYFGSNCEVERYERFDRVRRGSVIMPT